MIDLWAFLTVAVVVWGVVALVQSRSKTRQLKQIAADSDTRKQLEEKIERLEHRLANLETIIVEIDESKFLEKSGGQLDKDSDDLKVRHQPGTMSNKLK